MITRSFLFMFLWRPSAVCRNRVSEIQLLLYCTRTEDSMLHLTSLFNLKLSDSTETAGGDEPNYPGENLCHLLILFLMSIIII